VFDVTGVHVVNITYCECGTAGSLIPPRVQLLRNRWFPATWNRPGTAFTFRLLNFLHKLQSTSKVNLYDFHNAMISVLDGSGLSKPLVRTSFLASTSISDLFPLQSRYSELSLTFRVFVYLRQLRRGGCAHVVGGLSSLPKGSLAVECPACPHPGRNIKPSVERIAKRPP
jgi:CxC2 like cysteine cluster associated with KDZ transposases